MCLASALAYSNGRLHEVSANSYKYNPQNTQGSQDNIMGTHVPSWDKQLVPTRKTITFWWLRLGFWLRYRVRFWVRHVVGMPKFKIST